MSKTGKSIRTSQAVFFPFALFGNPGTAQGAEALADAVQEMLADNRREKRATRADAYAGHVRFEEFVLATLDDYAHWRGAARKRIRHILKNDDFLLWCAGNHLGVLPVYEELADTDTLVIQFDAHLDVYNLSECTPELSHGNFLMHCAGKLPPIISIGHRDLLLPAEHVGRYFQRVFTAAELALDPQPALNYVRAAARKAPRVFIDLDCDALDPAFFPGAAQPMPFGMSPQLLLRFIDAAWSPRLTGLAISEFDSAHDRQDRSLATLLWLVEYVLLRLYEV